MDDNIQQAIENARRTLYVLNPDETIAGKTDLYQRYQANAEAYARAMSQRAEAYAKAQSDPATLQAWPMTGMTYQQAIDSARDNWMSAGKVEVESALNLFSATQRGP